MFRLALGCGLCLQIVTSASDRRRVRHAGHPSRNSWPGVRLREIYILDAEQAAFVSTGPEHLNCGRQTATLPTQRGEGLQTRENERARGTPTLPESVSWSWAWAEMTCLRGLSSVERE